MLENLLCRICYERTIVMVEMCMLNLCTIPTVECEDLLKHMLTVEPSRRYSLQDVVSHQWTRGRTNSLTEDDGQLDKLINNSMLVDDSETSELSDSVLDYMENAGFERLKVEEVFISVHVLFSWQILRIFATCVCQLIYVEFVVGTFSL